MTQYARPDSDVSTGSWAASTGTDFFALIDETPASDADYISSTDWDGVSPDSLTVGLSNVSDPSNAINHVVTYRAKGTVGSGFTVPTLTVVLLQTGTTIATSVNSSSGTYTNYTFTLSEAEANSITDYDLLRLKFTRGVEMGYGEDNFVSQAFFECDSVVTTTTTTAAPSSSDETVFESVIKSARPSSFSPINSIH